MKQPGWVALMFLLGIALPCPAATKDKERPDREMLRMMDFLREMEMIKQMEMMQDLTHVEQAGDQVSNSSVQKSLPHKKKEATR